MRPKTLVLMGVAISCGLAASLLTAQWLQPPPVQVVVAKIMIPRGTPLADHDQLFELKEFPATAPLPAHCVTSFEQLRSRAPDHLLKHAMNPGEPLSLDNLIDRRSSLAFSVRAGYTALAVKATPESSFAGLLEPGNHVKVVTLKKMPQGEKKSVILMKNIRVLAIDTLLDRAPDRKSQVPNIITLEVTDDEVKKLRLAQEDGPLALGLTSPGDHHDRRGEPDEPLRLTVLVARKPIPRGASLKDHQTLFVLKEVSKNQLPANFVATFDQLQAHLKDHIVIKPLQENEPLSLDYLIQSEKGPALPLAYLTIVEGAQQRVYARNASGRVTLIESLSPEAKR